MFKTIIKLYKLAKAIERIEVNKNGAVYIKTKDTVLLNIQGGLGTLVHQNIVTETKDGIISLNTLKEVEYREGGNIIGMHNIAGLTLAHSYHLDINNIIKNDYLPKAEILSTLIAKQEVKVIRKPEPLKN